jgi:inhibitor of cysteine peptidase
MTQKAKFWNTVFVVAVIGVLIGGGILVYREQTRYKVVVVVADNKDSETINVGEKVSFKLASNPSTGYSWSVSQGYNTSVVNPVSSSYIAPDGDTVMGASGVQVFTFIGVGTGTTNLTMNYSRPWEQNTPPANTRVFTITVK